MKKILNSLCGICAVFAMSVNATDAKVKKDFDVLIESCDLNNNAWHGGTPKVTIEVNGKVQYDSSTKHKKTSGLHFNFKDQCRFSVLDGDTVKVQVIDVGWVTDTVQLSNESNSLDSIASMLEGKHEKGGAAYTFKLDKLKPRAGKYKVSLKQSTMELKEVKDKTWFGESDSSKASLFNEVASHRVIVKVNGLEVLDTHGDGDKCGATKTDWVNEEFELDWNPGDDIEVTLEHHNKVLLDGVVLTRKDNTDSSINIFKQKIVGGKGSDSTILFELIELKK